jgi:hypothetical protein
MMGGEMGLKGEKRPDPPPTPQTHEDYLVWRQTRLPEIERELDEIQANMRWIAEGRFRIPGARMPFR